MITFRAAAVTDADAHALLAEYFAERAEGFPTPGGYRTTFPSPEQFVPPAGEFLVVEADGVAVGCGGIRRIADADDGAARFEVKHLYLRPDARGAGAGRTLLAELERRAAAAGAQEIVLDTNASLEAAGALYRRSGYLDVEPYNDNPNADVWLCKHLRLT